MPWIPAFAGMTMLIISLRNALRLFRKELKEVGYDWRFLFRENKESLKENLKQELDAAQSPRHWQSILGATNSVIEEFWHSLDAQSKISFLMYFNRFWMNNRTPIPQQNATALLQMTDREQLSVYSGLQTIRYEKQENQYQAFFVNTPPLSMDWIINATGSSFHLDPADLLLQGLLNAGEIQKHPFGGIDVDFNTCAVISSMGQINPLLRVLGHNTHGVFYFVSSLEMIVKRAHKTACDVAIFLKDSPPKS